MTQRAEVTFRGADTLARTLSEAIDRITGGGQRQAALESAQLVAERSRRLAPKRTGALVGSISYARSGADSAVVTASARHAPFVHWGTRFMRPRPFMVTALTAEAKAIEQIYDAIVTEALRQIRGV